jgi:hypothetical protein
MKQSTLDKIKKAVSDAGTYPNPVIEYNFAELPKGVKPNSFFGVKAVRNNSMQKESAKVIYKLS